MEKTSDPQIGLTAQDCCKCGISMSLIELDWEWPSERLFCLSCAHDRIAALEDELNRLSEVVCEQDCEIIAAVLEG